ncbi:GntR family transcriptional regulator [Roseovarius salis]|uniref:GntR family transcriptional regulator n=1 Tax=Roseovarius salis TaxID=3376063 RepID=UPI0037CB635F
MEKRSETVDWSLGQTPSLSEQAENVLREAILNEVFKPGEKLVERTLADRTGVSRTIIREALGKLQAEGLVTRVQSRGMYVTRLSESEARAIYEARAILESAMARMFVARADDSDLAALDYAVDQAERTDHPEHAREHARDLDHVFQVITRGARNDVTGQMASLLRTRVTYLRTITSRVASAERRVESIRLLREIRAALKTRDADRAEKLIRGYVERSASFAVEVLRTINNKDQHDEKEG